MSDISKDDEAGARRIVFLGECMVELFHRPGDEAGTLRRTVGGDTLNAAIYCRRALGDTGAATVAYATRIGGDAFGLEIPGFIAAEGVEANLATVAAGEKTGLYAISRDAAGERSFSYWRSASAARRLLAEPNEAERLEAAIEASEALFFSGITLAILEPAARTRLLALARRMRDAGRLVGFDNNYRPKLWESEDTAREAIAAGHAAASLTLPSFDDEVLLFGDATPEATARRLLGLGAGGVIVKAGAEAAIVASTDGLRTVPGERAARVVDTTAAGDSFDGAALAARLCGGTLEQAARAGHRMASRVIGEYGAIVPRDATTWAEGPLASR
ncbi:sugar kinase [Antarcticirhabdus aurantiaca]|uniref:Sugar kinase n=1 Tax=Antarcticirhabdus aurantiaca TaxID=2606717 RepID=A0ACD4NL54_9HYPH|nr:sugar kinase [Antarcticirhabdus aurantiaca]WAJ27346.1 sugar kinase [Jeongeuplla avenae]